MRWLPPKEKMESPVVLITYGGVCLFLIFFGITQGPNKVSLEVTLFCIALSLLFILVLLRKPKWRIERDRRCREEFRSKVQERLLKGQMGDRI